MFDTFKSGFCSSDDTFETKLRLNPFHDYAACYWGYHAQTVLTDMEPLLLCLLSNEKQVSARGPALRVSEHRYKGYSQNMASGWNGFHLTAYFGLPCLMKSLLGKDRHLSKESAILKGARRGNKVMDEQLMQQANAETDLKDNDGRIPLSWAAGQGHEAVVRLLVERDDVKVDSQDNSGQTPLSRAAAYGYETVVKLLVERDDVEVDSQDHNGRTPLSWAAAHGHETVVKLLVERDDVEADLQDNDGWTPLSLAVAGAHEAVIRILLNTGRVDITAQDRHGVTARELAAFNGNAKVESLLAECGALVVPSFHGLQALFED